MEVSVPVCLLSCGACMSRCNEMLIRLHMYRSNLYDRIQVHLIHSTAKQLANAEVALPYRFSDKAGF